MLDYSHFACGQEHYGCQVQCGHVCACVCVCVFPMSATTTSKPQVEPVQAKGSPPSLTMSERPQRYLEPSYILDCRFYSFKNDAFIQDGLILTVTEATNRTD